MHITDEAIQFLQQLMKKRHKRGIRIGFNEKSTWGLSKFKLTLDEFRNKDYVRNIDGLTVYYREDVKPYLHRLYISYENRRLVLKDVEG
jgi:Fe-S cluster assembly iron-binding protein IscA